MAEPKSFKVGQAPWESNQEKQPSTFKVGQAPWEKSDQPEQSIVDMAINGVLKAGSAIDSVTGAPTRAALGRLQDGGGISDAAQAFTNQFAEPPQFAPTGKQIAQKAGIGETTLKDVFPNLTDEQIGNALATINPALKLAQFAKPTEITASGAAGLGIDVAADPTLFLPVDKIAQGLKFGATAIKDAKIAPKIIEGTADALRATTKKVGSTLTGLPEKNIETYIKNTKQVDDIIKATGGDVTVAADELRAGLQNAIQSKISSLGADIKDAIKNAPEGSVESNKAIVDALEKSKSAINPDLYPDAIVEVQDLINKVSKIGKDGSLDAAAANEAKMFLQDMAKSSYNKGGQVFVASDKASKAAKGGASQARKIEMALAPDTIAANRDLSRLHRFEKNANRNLFAEGKSESALMSAGSGQNLRNTKNLKDIGDLTGFDVLGGAENLSAARAFGKAGLDPVDNTGKALYRAVLGGSAGTAVAGPVGGLVGTLMSSPWVLKKAIQAGDISKDVVLRLAKSSGEVTDKVLEKAIKMAGTEEGLAILKAATVSPAGFKQVAIQNENLSGVDRWIAKGQQRVIETDSSLEPEFLDQVKSNKKFKDQLIRAGELPPGSGRMKEVIDSIKSSEDYKKFQKEKEKQAQSKEPDQAAGSSQPLKFPFVVEKDGYTAVVRNMNELNEARNEGWS